MRMTRKLTSTAVMIATMKLVVRLPDVNVDAPELGATTETRPTGLLRAAAS